METRPNSRGKSSAQRRKDRMALAAVTD